MMGRRPELYRASVRCGHCGKNVDTLETTAMHSGRRRIDPDGGVVTDGLVMGRAYCHGEYADIAIGFNELEKLNEDGGEIVLFNPIEVAEIRDEELLLTDEPKRIECASSENAARDYMLITSLAIPC